MTDREREFAALGVEYAEGIESVDKGFVYLGPESRKFIFKKNKYHYKGYYDDTPEVIFHDPILINLFKLALNPPKAAPPDEGRVC